MNLHVELLLASPLFIYWMSCSKYGLAISENQLLLLDVAWGRDEITPLALELEHGKGALRLQDRNMPVLFGWSGASL